ncbi:non-heme iron oxygenase ferredoxin subunit [Devriesea agamarum]|uniref:non-heme iron oxygenase ferredoxin subunit n=1 Tax=Devriesea agamarum TaxID=472569 RepID=UPI00071D4EDB|nr:non-heme iron oxygenase ferredoxin subunit [Devriesea agamarum]
MSEQSRFVKVAHTGDLGPGEVIGVEIDGVDVALARDDSGEIHAIGDICSHERVNLSDGEVEGCFLECWKHGSQFDLRTGAPQQLPATKPVPVYPVHCDAETGAISVCVTAAQTV